MLDSDTAADALPVAEAPPAQEACSAPAVRELDIRFTGSGSEYFRIWAVNLLLILLSCGLYLPFAKIRRIRYLYANTLIDGEALAFHGDAWKMFRGFLLLAVLMLAYTFAGEFSPAAALPAFLLLCAVWPALWRAAMQFRLGNTSWRGLRLGFEGSLAAAYLAYLPVAVPMALSVLLTPDGSGPSADPGMNAQFWFWMSSLGTGLAAPWSTALIKRYQHGGYRVAGERSQVLLRTRSVYFVGLKTVLLGAVMLFFAILCAVVLGSLLALVFTGKIDGKGNGVYHGLGMMAAVYLFGGSVVLSYYASRTQNLVWSNTRTASLRFRSELSGLMGLTLKNWLLIVATLGLYRPFAVIDTTRLRLQAVRIETITEPDTWVAPPQPRRSDASGDVAGDFFGMDVGL
jgi:uncharacterized membrane protein YjgN (DUF898 family)